MRCIWRVKQRETIYIYIKNSGEKKCIILEIKIFLWLVVEGEGNTTDMLVN